VCVSNVLVQMLAAGERERAMSLFRTAIKMDPSRADYLMNLGITYMMDKDYKSARVAFQVRGESGPLPAVAAIAIAVAVAADATASTTIPAIVAVTPLLLRLWCLLRNSSPW
jgi:Flp pilus assembly protein TadD